MIKEEQLYALVEQELRGTLSEPDARMLSDWIGRGTQEETAYQEVRSILEITQEGISNLDPKTDASWDALQAIMASGEANEEVTEEETPVIPLRKPRTRIYGIAAAIILLVMAGIYIAIPGDQNDVTTGQVFASAHGEMKQVNLPDGSIVTLSPESKLELAADFNEDMRQMKLEGEAFFDVARNEEKPFVVNVMNTETKVLGTSFNIAAYPASEQVTVSVMTGKVQFKPISSEAHLILTPNQAGQFDMKTNKLIRMETVAADDAAWKEGKLVFRKNPIVIALERVEKHYDLKFEVDPEVMGETVTTTIDLNNHAESDVIEILELTLSRLQFETTGNTVKIRK